MREAVIVSAVRSPVGRGKRDGAFADLHPVDLSAQVMRGAVERIGLDPKELEDVLWGCAVPEAAQGLNIARLALLRAGFPVEVAGATINRFCSSGLQTIAMAAQAVMTGMADAVLAGGVEVMSQVPMSGFVTRLHPDLTPTEWSPETYSTYIGMGFTAERVAERFGISREDQDKWAYRSHMKAAEAQKAGRFTEIVPIRVPKVRFQGAKKVVEEVVVDKDETIRPDTSLEALAKLRPAFKKNGTVTAGNSSPYSDGAAAVVVMSREKAEALGLKPLARFVSFAVAGVEPDIMGVGPVKAVPKALKRAGLTLDQIALIEFNEAFAAQVLAVMRALEMPEEKTNVNGGAIALGHPLGATGAKLTAQLLSELSRRGGGYGLVTMCIGGGMGAAGVFEVYPA
ncbi:acetyl-CoA acetyltransferase [Thermus thermophilus]|uniref:acetyl-CoA C-acyltransferase n=1 Tax=Thermus thermophilus TaxID=274 RepID=A0AAD1KTW3_THETH|nr:thiolase family protein [Thermus thermophilus]BBL82144.1 acetyl-CoA acetyltransferase [Thermus thermophilus]BBL84447.1 acetyl-CoA acetyltransferase [Thermus thermophilus]BCZ86793.1 acetyl-CoA acetyltransferase [Thermus thermophilus]BCZ89170.1 acetyl-CoA acetyltransferase [Thermus thermophilus]BCZ91802.1 acetyl-CoA acetyltransferase [Thermus thermophilus]